MCRPRADPMMLPLWKTGAPRRNVGPTRPVSSCRAEPLWMTAAEFEKFVADETDKWAKVVKFAGIKTE